MKGQSIYYLEGDNVDRGNLQVHVEAAVNAAPIENATVSISYSGEPDSLVEQLQTDISGLSDIVEIHTPPFEYSMQPDQPQPYAQVTVQVEADGYQPVNISGIEVFSERLALQRIRLTERVVGEGEYTDIAIPPNRLYGDYPPKIAEAEIKPVNESGEIVLSKVVIPEYIVVHNGVPTDPSAKDYYVKYKDYIKNVASSEIYSTWPDSTIRANVLAIMSFTLNRVYTEWYHC